MTRRLRQRLAEFGLVVLLLVIGAHCLPFYTAPGATRKGLPCDFFDPCLLSYLISQASGPTDIILLPGVYPVNGTWPSASVGWLNLTSSRTDLRPVLQFAGSPQRPWLYLKSSLVVDGIEIQGLQSQFAEFRGPGNVTFSNCLFSRANAVLTSSNSTLHAKFERCIVRDSVYTLVGPASQGSTLSVDDTEILASKGVFGSFVTISGSNVTIRDSLIDGPLLEYSPDRVHTVRDLRVVDSQSFHPLFLSQKLVAAILIPQIYISNYTSYSYVASFNQTGSYTLKNWTIERSYSTSFLHTEGITVELVDACWNGNWASEGLITASQGNLTISNSSFTNNTLTSAGACGSVVKSSFRAKVTLSGVHLSGNSGGVSAVCAEDGDCCSQHNSDITWTNNTIAFQNDDVEVGYCFQYFSNPSFPERKLCKLTPERSPVAVNPCQDINPCDSESTICVIAEIGRSVCECQEFFERISPTRCAALPYLASPEGDPPNPLKNCRSSPCDLVKLLQMIGPGDVINITGGVYKEWPDKLVFSISFGFTVQASPNSSVTFDFESGSPRFEFPGGSGTAKFIGIDFHKGDDFHLQTESLSVEFTRCKFLHFTQSSEFALLIGQNLTFNDCELRNFTGSQPLVSDTALASSVSFINSRLIDNSIALARIGHVLFSNTSMVRGSAPSLSMIEATDVRLENGCIFTANSGLQSLIVLSGDAARLSAQDWRVEASDFAQALISAPKASPNALTRISITNSTFSSTIGPSVLDATGAIFFASGLRCFDNTARCLNFTTSAVTIADSVFLSLPSVTGCPVTLDDPTPAANISTSSFNENGGDGSICLKTSACYTALYLTDPNIPTGPCVFIDYPTYPCEHLCSYPSGCIEASYPIRLRLPDNGLQVTVASKPAPYFALQLVDQFNQTVSPGWCKRLPVCWNPASSLRRRGDTPTLACLGGGFIVSLAPDSPPGNYNVSFGSEYCTPPSEFKLRLEITVVITEADDATFPFGAIVGLAVAAAVVIIGSFSLALVLIRRKLKEKHPTEMGYHGLTNHRELAALLDDDGQMALQPIYDLLNETKIPIIDPDDIEDPQFVGEGATGKVLVGVWTRKNMRVAIKQISTLPVTDDNFSETQQDKIKELIQEMGIMVQLSHPNLLPLLGCSVLGVTDLRLVLPYIANKSLENHITTLPNEAILPILKQIAWGCEYLHSKSWTHRDLKPENILTSIEPGGSWKVYLCDFALAKATASNITGVRVGTPAYMAPEVIRIAEGNKSAAIDVYSFGVIMLEMITHTRAFASIQMMSILRNVREGRIPTVPESFENDDTRPHWLSREIVGLVKRCLSPDPKTRPSMKEICATLRQY